MKYSDVHWKVFNLSVRRFIAIGFVVIGLVLTLFGIPSVLPGGTVLVNGVPSDDLVLRWIVLLLPLVVVLLDIALYRAQPYVPRKE